MLCLGRAFSSPGSRHAQQDCFVVWEGVHLVWGHLALYAVLDGHCGVVAAEFVRARVVSEVLGDERWNKSVFPCCEQVLREAVARLESGVLSTSAKQHVSDGTTLCLLLFVNGILFVANVGDSRALLICEDGSYRSLTISHSLSDAHELNRVQQAGAIIRNGRMLGPDKHLDVTRALGDRDHKLDATSALSAEPDISKHQMQSNDSVILLATDGLWNTQLLDEQELANMALNEPHTTPLPERARTIVNEALRFNSRDNVTLIFLKLKVPPHQYTEYVHATAHDQPVQGVRFNDAPQVPQQFKCLHWETSLPLQSSSSSATVKRRNGKLPSVKSLLRLFNVGNFR